MVKKIDIDHIAKDSKPLIGETTATIAKLITIISFAVAIYAKADNIDDNIVAEHKENAEFRVEMRKNYIQLSDSVSTLSREMRLLENQELVTREVIRIDPEMSAKLDYLTRIIEQSNSEKKNLWNPLTQVAGGI